MNIFKKAVAVLMALAMILSFAACGDKPEEVQTTTAAPETTTAAPEATTEAAETTALTEIAEESTTEESTTEETTAEIITTTAAPTTQATTTVAPATTTKKAETTTQKAAVPATKAEIVALYNQAAATAASAKPGYSKTTVTALNNLQMGALAKINLVRETVGDFLGEGTTTTTVKKGSFNGTSLVKSSLKESDVVSATCTPSADGKYYNIKITVKNESNLSKGSSALSRFTKDYKDAKEIKDGLTEAGAGVNEIMLKTTSVVITAKIEAATNRFVSLEHSIKMSAVLTDVKYTIAKVKQATSDLVTNVKYSSFKY